jgi:putative hemolysin
VHEDELNYFVSHYADKQGVDFLEAVLGEMKVNIVTEGYTGWIESRRTLFVANHPLGGLDGMAFMLVVGKKLKDIVFPVNDLLMHIPNLQQLFVPVNKHGRNSHLVKAFDDTFASDKSVLYFPAGLCSRKTEGKIIDLDWKKTVVVKARNYQRNIVPVYIEGRNSDFFYNLANLRSRLGIKANLEMLFLADEMFRQKDKTIRLTFGNPISFKTFDTRFTDTAWAAKLKKHVYAIGKNSLAEFKD